MELKKISETVTQIDLTESDIESAIRQFICTCHPEFAIHHTVNPVNEKEGFELYRFIVENKNP